MFRSKYALSVLLSAVLYLSAACERSEIQERYYSNYEKLQTFNEPGNWVPSFIPRTAVEIKAKFKIDTGAELLTFYFGDLAEIALVPYCNKVMVNEVELPLSTVLKGVAWWPKPLFRDLAKSEELGKYALYRCERQAFFASVREDGRYQGFYWRISLK